MKKWEKYLANFLHWGNRINAIAYASTMLGYYFATNEIPPFEIWVPWLVSIGVGYGIKDFFLEGKTHLSGEEIKKYPRWIRNHLEPYLDGYAIKRRILMEAEWFK